MWVAAFPVHPRACGTRGPPQGTVGHLGPLRASESLPFMETLGGEWLSVPTSAAQRRTWGALPASMPWAGRVA